MCLPVFLSVWFLRSFIGVRAFYQAVRANQWMLLLTGAILFATLIFFGAIGVQYLQDGFHGACVLPYTGTLTNASVLVSHPRQMCTRNSSCPVNQYCDTNYGPNPLQRGGDFDNVGHAVVVLFQVASLSTWWPFATGLMYAYVPWVLFFFVLVILFVRHIVVNLFVAIVLFGFSTATASIKDEYMRQQARAGADVQNEEEEERRQDGRRMDWRGIKMEEYCR